MVSLTKNGLVILAVLCVSFLLQAKPQGAPLSKVFSDSYGAEANKNYIEAIQVLKNAYDEKSYEINLRLGWLYFSNKDYTKSLEYYSKAISLKPKCVEARLGYIKPASTLEMWDKVLEKYEEILKIDPNHTYSSYWAGIIYYNRGKFDQAINYFKKVTDLYPTDTESLAMQGWCKFKLGKRDQAKEFFEKALLQSPLHASSLEGMKALGVIPK